MIVLPIILSLGYLYVAKTLYFAGESPDNYDNWLKEPNDLEIVE